MIEDWSRSFPKSASYRWSCRFNSLAQESGHAGIYANQLFSGVLAD